MIKKHRLLDAGTFKLKTTSFITSDAFFMYLLGSFGLMVVFLCAIMSNYAWGHTSKGTLLITSAASFNIPYVKEVEEEDILDNYEIYFNFVTKIGKNIDPLLTQRLIKRYFALKKADSRRAALFLKGLRYEIEHFRSLKGRLYKRDFIAWMKKYLSEWYREVDEYCIRSYIERLKSS